MSETSMMNYILETGKCCLNIIDNSKEFTKELVKEYCENDYSGLVIVASGSSFNGSELARYYVSKYLQKEVSVVTPFTFLNHQHDFIENKMVICISQSGCSTNTLQAIELVNKLNKRSIALVGRDNSDALKIADITVNWQVGEEKIGFVTKGVISLGIFLSMFSLEVALKKNSINEKEYQEAIEDLKLALKCHKEIVDKAIETFNENKEDFVNSTDLYFLASGANFATALEGALKISETSCISAKAVETEEFLHGPLYPTNENSLIFVIGNNEHPSTKRSQDIAVALQTITKKVYFIGSCKDVKCIDSTLQSTYLSSPFYKLAALQTIAYLRTEATNQYKPSDGVLQFKKENKVASKSRDNLYLNLQEGTKK